MSYTQEKSRFVVDVAAFLSRNLFRRRVVSGFAHYRMKVAVDLNYECFEGKVGKNSDCDYHNNLVATARGWIGILMSAIDRRHAAVSIKES